jgi:hypothetical protein
MSDDLVLDLTSYKDRVGSRVVPGTYRVQVEDAEITESAAKNQMINLWFTVVEGEFQGQTVVDRLVLTEKSLFRVVGFMQGIGLPTPKKKLKINIRQFVGRVLDIDVEDGEPYNGRIRSEVRGYRKVAGAQQNQGADLPEDDEDEPAAAAPVEAAAPAAAAPAKAPLAVDSDDLDLDSVDL